MIGEIVEVIIVYGTFGAIILLPAWTGIRASRKERKPVVAAIAEAYQSPAGFVEIGAVGGIFFLLEQESIREQPVLSIVLLFVAVRILFGALLRPHAWMIRKGKKGKDDASL